MPQTDHTRADENYRNGKIRHYFRSLLKLPTLRTQPFAMGLVVRKHTTYFVPKRW